jgi:divalent metal cation (Fe/Co/Zn/Cd) transporter
MFLILLLCTGLKLILYFYCQWARQTYNSDTLEALSEDHLNDVMSNITAIITAWIAFTYPSYWWVDPTGALIISFVIVYRWGHVIADQIRKIVGYTASTDFIDEVNTLALNHDSRIDVDVTRAYHFGKSYIVEMEIILPALMTVKESHDIALSLQHKIETFESVERAFVHVRRYHDSSLLVQIYAL